MTGLDQESVGLGLTESVFSKGATGRRVEGGLGVPKEIVDE
jgi:hypothetical protein